MNRNKCNRCGLINSSGDENCRRCKTDLHSAENAPPRYAPAPSVSDTDAPKKIGSFVTSFAIFMLIVIVFGYFQTRDDEKIRMNLIMEKDRQRQNEMEVEREKNRQREESQKYNRSFNAR